MTKPVYLMWYNDNPKMSATSKIAEAIDAYADHFNGITPNVVLVNEDDVTEYRDVQVRSASYIRRNIFWVGREPIES